jgi:hypothetical protein
MWLRKRKEIQVLLLQTKMSDSDSLCAGDKKVFYFGCMNVPGHYLYGQDGHSVPHYRASAILPFRYEILDGGLLPQNGQQVQSEKHLAIINGWTIVSMWDRTGDSRAGSNSSFIAEGIRTREEVLDIAKLVFPNIVNRIFYITGKDVNVGN